MSATLNICGLLEEHGHDIRLWTFNASECKTELSHVRQPASFYGICSEISGWHATEPLDAIYLHTPWCRTSLRLARFSKQIKVPYVVSTHGMLDPFCLNIKPLRKTIYLYLCGRRYLQGAKLLHTTATYEQTQVSQLLRCLVDSVPVVPLPLPRTNIDPASRRADSCNTTVQDETLFRILFLGRVHPIKNLEAIIGGFRIASAYRNLHLTIAGPIDPAYRQVLSRIIDDANLTNRIEFVGLVSGDAKEEIIGRTDAALLVSHHENFGMAIVELMNREIPVIVSRGVAIWQELQTGGAEIADSESEIAEAIMKFCDDREMAKDRGRLGARFVRQWLSRPTLAKKYEELFLDAPGRTV